MVFHFRCMENHFRRVENEKLCKETDENNEDLVKVLMFFPRNRDFCERLHHVF